jgi:hypothetical protein
MGQTGCLQYNSKVDHNDARDRLESIETIQDNVLIVTVFITLDRGTYSTSSNRKINAIRMHMFLSIILVDDARHLEARASDGTLIAQAHSTARFLHAA